MGTGSFPGVKSGRGVTLTPHPVLAPRSRKGRAIPLLPLWVVLPVQRLSACTRGHFTFTFTSCQRSDLNRAYEKIYFAWFQSSAAMYTRSALFRDFTQCRKAILYWHFRTTYRSQSWVPWPLKMGRKGCTETSVRNCLSTLRKITEERRSQEFTYIHCLCSRCTHIRKADSESNWANPRTQTEPRVPVNRRRSEGHTYALRIAIRSTARLIIPDQFKQTIRPLVKHFCLLSPNIQNWFCKYTNWTRNKNVSV